MNKVINNRGLELIKKFEGFEGKPYLCPAGVPTIGYGTTYYSGGRKVSLKDKEIDEKQAQAILLSQLTNYVRVVNLYLTSVEKQINDDQFSALVCFAYNVGLSNLQKSTLLKCVLKNPNDECIAAEFKKWIYANGKKLGGLLSRRQEECNLYFTKQ
jgi:lysozyme